MSSEAKNLKAICDAMDRHDKNCEFPLIAVMMNPFEVDRLGWETIKGIPIRGDSSLSTGMFMLLCNANLTEDEDIVEAVSEERELIHA